MELSMNISNLLGRYDLEKCVEIYKKAGFTAVDYSLGDMIQDDSIFNSDQYRTVAEDIRRTIEAGGLRVNQTHAPYSFSKSLWGEQECFQDVIVPRIIRCLEISSILGADIAVVHPLHHWEYHGHEEEIFNANMKYYRDLIPYCKEYNIKVGVENMWRRDPLRKYISLDTCGTIEEFIRYIDTLDSEYMVACLDVGHVALPMMDERAHDFVRALGHDRLKALHIHDNDFVGDQHLLPFLGKMDWGSITQALGEIDYTGDFTYEVGGGFLNTVEDGFVQTAANYMGDVGKFLVSQINANRPR